MRRSRQLLELEERGLGLGQAHGSLDSDSAGADPTIAMVDVAMNLSIKYAAPQ